MGFVWAHDIGWLTDGLSYHLHPELIHFNSLFPCFYVYTQYKLFWNTAQPLPKPASADSDNIKHLNFFLLLQQIFCSSTTSASNKWTITFMFLDCIRTDICNTVFSVILCGKKTCWKLNWLCLSVTVALGFLVNLPQPTIPLVCGRKPEYPEISTVKTCKLTSKTWTRNCLALMLQCGISMLPSCRASLTNLHWHSAIYRDICLWTTLWSCDDFNA